MKGRTTKIKRDCHKHPDGGVHLGWTYAKYVQLSSRRTHSGVFVRTNVIDTPTMFSVITFRTPRIVLLPAAVQCGASFACGRLAIRPYVIIAVHLHVIPTSFPRFGHGDSIIATCTGSSSRSSREWLLLLLLTPPPEGVGGPVAVVGPV
jgi:hypothetical protein